MTAVEPSAVMIAQRPAGAAPAVQAAAENLPFPDASFDAAMAIITIHHWNDVDAGLAELRRVARRRVVVVMFDPELEADLWIARDYLGEHAARCFAWMPQVSLVLAAFPEADARPLLVPNDCSDRMFATLWARPEEYLDPQVRAGTSVRNRLPAELVTHVLARLGRDLDSGAWDRRYGHLRATPELDCGLRLITAEVE